MVQGETERHGRSSCVVQGKDENMVRQKIEEILIYNPQSRPKRFETKDGKNVGMYITWVDEYNDKVEI